MKKYKLKLKIGEEIKHVDNIFYDIDEVNTFMNMNRYINLNGGLTYALLDTSRRHQSFIDKEYIYITLFYNER